MAPRTRRVRANNPFKIGIILVLVLVVLGGAGFLLYWQRQQQQIADADATATATSARLQATDQAALAYTQATQGVVAATATAVEADLDHRYLAAVALQDAGDYVRARAGYLELIGLQPGYKDSTERLKQVNEALAESYYQQGAAAAAQKLWGDAVTAFDNALNVIPNYKDTAARRAEALNKSKATVTPKPPTTTPTLQPTAAGEATATAQLSVTGEITPTEATSEATSEAQPTAAGESTLAATPVIAKGPTIGGSPGQNAQPLAAVDSDHPYKNDENKAWTIPNDSGKSAARIHFSRIEIENNVDLIEIRDAEDRLIQEIPTSAPEGFWTEVVPGAVIRVVLKSDSSGAFWGFKIDQIEPIAYITLAYSPHPYPNGSTEAKTLINDTPNPAGTRVHFDYIDLEDGVDYLVIKDVDDNPYQWITGSHPDGFTSKAVPGSSIKVQLVSDGSGRAWGYNIAKVETVAAEKADLPPDRPKALAESDHPYTNDFSKAWTITNPDVKAVSSKIHFSRLSLEYGDAILVLDVNDTLIQVFARKEQLVDLWSDYVPGRVVKIKLLTSQGYEDWGFRVDAIASSVSNPGLAQSDHFYPNDITKVWTITNPDVNTISSKIHFDKMALEYGDVIQVLDANDTVIQTFAQKDHVLDMWSDYVPGRVVKIKLITTQGYEDWGFRVDAIVNSVSNPGLAQSDHPYADNSSRVWSITNPDVNASASRVHFNRIALEYGDTLQVLDANDTVIQTFAQKDHLTDLWSDTVRGRVVKIQLITTQGYEDWGFRVDEIQTVK